jgi:biotin transporter BioY
VDIFTFFRLCREIPTALFTGYFQVDERNCVRGFPARLVGLCFLVIVGFVVTATIISATSDELATPLLFGGFFVFIFCVIVAATVCVACAQKIDPGAERARRAKSDDRW